MSLRGSIERYESAERLARAAADDFVRLARSVVEARGRFCVALTGGCSPLRLYSLLAGGESAPRVPWERVHLFWGDERAVPPRHPRSNFGMAYRLLVSRVPIPDGNVHRIRGEDRPADEAPRYEAELRSFFGGEPRFDLVYLGLGDDGHVASLFPFDLPRLTERDRVVLPSFLRALGERRVSLTFRAINTASRIEFLVPSAAKARIATVASSGPLDPFRVPAQLVRPVRGDLHWRLVESKPLGLHE